MALTAATVLLAVVLPQALADDHDQLVLSIGAYDMVRREDDSGYLGLDYRIPGVTGWRLKPWAGLLSTSDEAFWGGAGVYYDLSLGDRVRVTPSFGAGLYDDGVGKDLGHTVEFRSQLEFSYHFESLARVGVTFGHLSNGGLADSNKGTEYLNVSYTLPLGRRRPGAPIHAGERASADRPEE